MNDRRARLLFVEDDRNFRTVTEYTLKEHGFQVRTATNGREGLEILDEWSPDLVLCDLKMPVMDGLEFLGHLRDRSGVPPVLVLTAYGSIENAVEAMHAGAIDYITKPINHDVLKLRIDRALTHSALVSENRSLKERSASGRHTERIIGVSGEVLELRSTLLQLAQSDASVLLQGESGTGKELAARALHFDGARANAGQFIVMNCAAIPGELLESELFGHRAGAFTGAKEDKTGRFQAAHKGTLFLDEIGDMPLNLQAKLLRCLQDGEITPVGGVKAVKVDVRVVAATNQSLEAMIASGQFRSDLYYRLAVVPVELPPLRERPGDLIPLIRHFLDSCGRPEVVIADETVDLLETRPWAGNVRELQNIVIRACALRPELDRLEPEDISPPGPHQLAPMESGPLDLDRIVIPESGLPFEEVERRLLEAAWEKAAHNQKRGAELLALPRQAFVYRLQKYGILPKYGKKNDE